jgi:hypothetical protein
LKQAPGTLYIGSGKEGATKIVLDDAKAALSKLEADDLVVQAKAPAGANSSTSGFAARVLDAKTPPAPYYHDGDGIGAGEAEWYAPGDEPSVWVSRGGPDNCPEASNADQTDTDADGIAGMPARRLWLAIPSSPTPAHRGERPGGQPTGRGTLIRAGAYCSPGSSSCPYSPECVEGAFSEAHMHRPE